MKEFLLRRRRVDQIRGSIEESTGLSAIAVRQALATAEGVYADIRRGLATIEYEVDGPLSFAA